MLHVANISETNFSLFLYVFLSTATDCIDMGTYGVCVDTFADVLVLVTVDVLVSLPGLDVTVDVAREEEDLGRTDHGTGSAVAPSRILVASVFFDWRDGGANRLDCRL